MYKFYLYIWFIKINTLYKKKITTLYNFYYLINIYLFI